jgi:hypothetical protein
MHAVPAADVTPVQLKFTAHSVLQKLQHSSSTRATHLSFQQRRLRQHGWVRVRILQPLIDYF